MPMRKPETAKSLLKPHIKCTSGPRSSAPSVLRSSCALDTKSVLGKTPSAYTSSTSTCRARSRAQAMASRSSDAVMATPVGLPGCVRMSRRGLCPPLTAASNPACNAAGVTCRGASEVPSTTCGLPTSVGQGTTTAPAFRRQSLRKAPYMGDGTNTASPGSHRENARLSSNAEQPADTQKLSASKCSPGASSCGKNPARAARKRGRPFMDV